MALRHRDLIPTAIDRENIIAKHPVKGHLTKQSSLGRRPALSELNSNKPGQEKPVAKKGEPSKEIKPALKKTISAPSLKIPEPKSYTTTQLENVIDPDENSKNDPQMVSEYMNDIYEYLRELETRYFIKEEFLKGHPSTPRMRAILVNWLVQVHTNFKLTLETLHLCVALIDRYLQVNRNIGREILQLVGASALLIACKYEEIFLPETDDFVYVCDDTFTKKQVLKMELDILIKLECNLGRPCSVHFLRRYSKIGQVTFEEHTLAKYILELALLEYSLCHIKPSIQAAAACCLAVCVLKEILYPEKVWNATLVHYTTYKYTEFEPVMGLLANLLLNAPNSKNQAVRSKYSSSCYNKISLNSKLLGRVVKKFSEKQKTVSTITKVK